MVKRWLAARMINAECNFHRVKGCEDRPTLVAALNRHVNADVTPFMRD